jgi:drug/metabolite transporter (DMT)-like permease
MTDRRSAARLWAALLIVYLVWGSTYLAIRVVVQGGLPPLLSMGIRFLLAAPLLAAFVALRSGLGRLSGGMADVERWGILLTLLAATCWGIGSFYSRSWGVPTDSLVATVYQMALGGIVAVAMGLARGEGVPLQVGVLPASTWVAFGYLVVVGSMVAYTA